MTDATARILHRLGWRNVSGIQALCNVFLSPANGCAYDVRT